MSWFCGKFGLIVLFISICCLYILSFYFDLRFKNVLNFKSNQMINHNMYVQRLRDHKMFKKILFWNGMFGNKNFYFGDDDIFKNCQFNKCYATYDRSFTDVENFDAILFHGVELNENDLPKKRNIKQRYVFVNLESPENRPITNGLFENYFNDTMTYRLDSDIVWPYGLVRDLKTNKIVAPSIDIVWDFPNNDDKNNKLSSVYHLKDNTTIANKKKEIAWLVSNCPAKSGRLEYVKELSKYISVDIYGLCGDDQTCPHSRNCFKDLIEPQYYFYLSFENSLCQDYVTEKLYKPLRYNILPIVYGGANYSRFVPKDSYIDALNFDSPETLAIYLKRLITNPKEYREYFRWKKYYRIEDSTNNVACSLCKFLHTERKINTYSRLSNWYSRNKCPLHKLLYSTKYVTRMSLNIKTYNKTN
ncbi:alpha-(1,3)-fucosyltransferase C-like [Vespa crabro]|uniref:alpha-(1,3)-fucosyltransferase C-like n=1 Tax=Vespa crabro TaxID=7445 RepID=UPI001F015080|nr:alpha-(1,3)-fucosyltransferase C-like [Vespa crabro]XP_046827912.1 alpha-(1,3)-fucosyltransferase C-like [Vespa crabro]XP_046827913.1 alpha-(1,3)-fucosyltransferase C-like [Vespa crabro]XP_046827914.1 alpha-(1,3)-fucosyltransferase C-like [Vespa crabro]XP_046827915.1 alpha-(1,3)-fucosyltransferase C-like [Vespa crabro]XP_046827916.1 alpha-(1,3)-fucosyltransferase C-like [Vespa crabro]XP_046827917.1 alpha-(1,3)-fucosyltransferase C-like [Vespa crabro]XP_046827919.1 alpha-(1,3)-fucosyltrans